ncbi:DNA polymerase III subunit epsilon, partial [Luteimonas sp. 8-5]|nr:DNA polymerase III subunit epsilon [Luteimonas sp. 8-5]
ERLAGTEAPRPRVQVPAADLAAHEERLARLRARAGHAVWDRAAVAAPEAEAEAIPA